MKLMKQWTLLLWVLPTLAIAQSTPLNVEEMVRALTPPPAKTRSLGVQTRNLQPSLDLTIHFDLDSSVIREESKKPLQDLATALRDGRLGSFKFQVEGHTDSRGSAAYNEALSARRAESVAIFLSTEGVAPDRLVAVGKGFREPLDAVDTKAAINRRVRIVTQP
jgi:outer membrane protein OmpA-like peptidoglycan-associated protein